MAQAELETFLSKFTGRLTGKSQFYATRRHGRTVVSNYPKHKNSTSITESQKANSASFGEISKQAKTELSNPERLAYWEELYAAHLRDKKAPKSYATLRGFVIGQLSKNK